MTQTSPTLWLAMITEDETEYHARYEGHNTIEGARAEMAEINRRLIKDKKLPMPYYIYEAPEPLHGYEPYNLDDLDFNFYRELTPEEQAHRDKQVKELEEAFATGNNEVIEKTAKKVLEEAKEQNKK